MAEKAQRTMPGWINSQLLLSHACSTAAYHADFLLSGRKIHSLTGQRMQPSRRSWPVQSQAFQAVGLVRDFLQTPFFLHLSQRSSGSVNTQQYASFSFLESNSGGTGPAVYSNQSSVRRHYWHQRPSCSRHCHQQHFPPTIVAIMEV